MAGIAVAGHYAREHQRRTDDTTALIVLTMQSKVLAAASALSPAAVRRELPRLDRLATTPSLARALAALNAYALPEGGTERAMALLDRHAGELDDPGERELHRTVRRAIEDPGGLDPSEQALLRAELKWFGKLLLAHARAPEDPLRREVSRAAMRAFAATLALLGAAGLLTLAGAALLLLAALQRGSSVLRPRFDRGVGGGAVYLQAFAVYLGSMLAVDGGLALSGLEHPALGLAGVALGSLAGVAWPLLRGVPAPEARRALGIHRGAGWLRETGCGLVGYVAILPVLALGVLLTFALLTVPDLLFPPGPDEPPRLVGHPVLVWMARGPLGVRLGVLFLAAAFAPFFEEVMFRGALFRSLRERHGAVLSALAMALVFAVIHPQGLATIPALTALGFGFAMLREWRDSLIAPMVAHAAHNGTLVGFMWLVFAAE